MTEDTANGIGGGLLIYAKINIVGGVSVFSTPELESYNQCCAIRIPLEGKSTIVVVIVYRPHSVYKDTIAQQEETTHNNNQLCLLLSKIPHPCIIVGDFNYSQISWDVMSYNSSCKEFVNAVQDNFLSQHIDFPTHISGTQPDILLSSQPDLIMEVEDICHLGSSDHTMVLATVAGSVPLNTTFEEVPDWRNADIEMLKQELTSLDWGRHLDNLDTLRSWEAFKNIISDA